MALPCVPGSMVASTSGGVQSHYDSEGLTLFALPLRDAPIPEGICNFFDIDADMQGHTLEVDFITEINLGISIYSRCIPGS